MGKKKKRRFCLYLTRPFKVIAKNKTAFSLWAMSTLLAGNIGLLLNVIIRAYSGKAGVVQSVMMDMTNGSLYLFSIVLLASSFGSVLIDFVSRDEKDFKQPKTLWFFISILVWFICGVFYAAFMNAQLPPNETDMSGDIAQYIFFIITVVLSIYSYCLIIMDANDPDFKELSDKYEKKEEQSIHNLEKDSNQLTTDKKGNRL